MENVLERCRELLREVTPLTADCGRLCSHACCASRDGEETGMLLFPGEEAYYEGREGWTLRDTPQGRLVMCNGSCDRAERPLGCRIFPLLPVVRGDVVKVAMDARARSVCPLCDAGVKGLRSEFSEAVRQCGELLLRDPAQKDFLLRLTEDHDELRALQKRFGGR